MLFDRHNLRVSLHCGPVRDDGGSRVRYVIDKSGGQGCGSIELGWQEVREVVHALLLDMLGTEIVEPEMGTENYDHLRCVRTDGVRWHEAGTGQNRGAP